MFKKILTLVILLVSVMSYSQKLIIDGVVSGYNYNPTKGIFKKGSKILLEGHLANVSIIAFQNKKLVTKTKTNSNGKFHLELENGGGYRIELVKNNYGQIAFNIDLLKAPKDKVIQLSSLELILNSYVPKKKDNSFNAIGVIGFNPDLNNFYFNEEKDKSLFSKKEDNSPLVSLILESILKNKNNIFAGSGGSSKTYVNSNTDSVSTPFSVFDSSNVASSAILNSYNYSNLFSTSQPNSNQSAIEQKQSTIDEAKKQLAIDKLNAKTDLDFLLIADRELLIEAAEKELDQLKEIISQKEEALSLKNRQLFLLLGIFIVLLVLVFFIFKSNREKAKLNNNLQEKNKKINDSIEYAKKIQTAILPSITDLETLLPNSFILYKPKDKVSGDFYWFEEVKNKVIIAAVDCTGHGVPGALMSMIGNTLMNNIIIEKKNTEPKDILNLLNADLKLALNQIDSDPFASQDGMDMSIMVIDKLKNTITYAGAMNSIYCVKDGEIKLLDVNKRGIGGFDFYEGGEFTQSELTIEKGSQFYMLSDGFQDQFGGSESQKYNTTQFELMIKECEGQSAKIQKEILEMSLENWQGKEEQTDDILVIGINL